MDTYYIIILAVVAFLLLVYIVIRRVTNPHNLTREDIRLVNAVVNNELEQVKQLLKSSANPNAIDKKGLPVLLIALHQGNEKIARALMTSGAAIDARAPQQHPAAAGATPLIAAAAAGLWGIAKKMVLKGARVDVSDQQGFTPLMAAAYAGLDGLVQLLVDKGASVNTQDNQGYTAIMYAANARQIPCAEVLVQQGADLGLTDKSGQTALDYARKNGHQPMVTLLHKARIRQLAAENDTPNTP